MWQQNITPNMLYGEWLRLYVLILWCKIWASSPHIKSFFLREYRNPLSSPFLRLMKHHMDSKPNGKSHQHIWCFSFKYRQCNIQIESSTVAIILLLYAAAAFVLSGKAALFLLWQRSVYSLSVKLWRKKDHSYLSDWWASEFISAISKVSMNRCPLSVYTNMFDAPG